MEDTNAERTEIEQTWNKIESVSKQRGLRDGISDGRDSNFQKSFDIGYEEGFRNGYLLGKSRGLIVAHSKQNKSEAMEHPLLEKMSRGDCSVCKDNGLLEKDIKEITDIQDESYKQNLQELKTSLRNISTNCELP